MVFIKLFMNVYCMVKFLYFFVFMLNFCFVVRILDINLFVLM